MLIRPTVIRAMAMAPIDTAPKASAPIPIGDTLTGKAATAFALGCSF